MRIVRVGPFAAADRTAVADDILRGRVMRVRGYTTLSHVSTGELATAALHNTLLDDIASIKTSISDDGLTFSGLLTRAPLQTFRGLCVRTHPDNDKAANQVAVPSLEEILMSDGVRYSGFTAAQLAALSADITVAGAGGLDTGARAVSTWYEIHAIGKSSTTALADVKLLLHRAKNYAADQSFTTAPDATRALRLATSTATDKLAQGVTFTLAGAEEFLDVKLTRTGSVVGNIWFTIEADSAGSPSGTPLATSDKIDASGIATSAELVRLVFRTPLTMTAALYHLVLQGDYTRSDAVFIAWSGVAAGGYAGGSAKQYNGASWSAATGVGDFYFKTYVTQNDTALTMPSGYDEKCKIGYVYNTSANALRPFIARNRDVFVGQTAGAVISGVTSTSPALTDVSTQVPPTPVTLCLYASATSGDLIFLAGVPDGFNASSAPLVAGYSGIPTTGFYIVEPDVATEFQAFYAWNLNANAFSMNLTGYRW